MFCTSGKEMGAPTGNGMHDSARELTEMASTQFAFYGLMNPYTYQRPKITPLPNETGLTVPGWGSGIEGGTGERLIPGMEGVVTGGDSTKLGKKMMESMGLPRGTNWTVNRRISKRRN